MRLVANKPMTYSTRRLSAGDLFTVSNRDARLLVALQRARLVEDTEDGPKRPSGENPGAVNIPDGWQDLGWPALKALAASVSPSPVKTKDDAIAAVERELKRRA